MCLIYQAEGFMQKEIAKRMYVSEATVNKVCRIFKKWGCVRDPFADRVGRRKIFTRQDMLVLERLVKDKVDWYLDELVSEISQFRNFAHLAKPVSPSFGSFARY
ncbi:hypothetical protein RhiirA1_403231 [Rhizophagus irregularis]|uniref:Homeodomain-like protein n=1 Tax=Rhizophagus irregularis TaxID=588596 RepID=A0A2N0QV93_9GLOM|nr:hypothetical protein RhiirA1_403231 [Rhizophagus irregularis]